MKRLFAGLVAIPILLSVPAIAQDAAPLETLKQRFSYLVGMQLAGGMMQQGLHEKLDIDALAQALRDRFSGAEPRLTEDQMKETVAAIQAEEASQKMAGQEKAKAMGAAFLAENKAKPGVVTTATGVQYTVTTKGAGPMPKAAEMVKVHYEGRLLDGTVFDSSYARNDPATFGVGQVIPGWQEALQLMPVGSKWEVWIPSDLAYGPQGAGGAIGPNETLNFTIELLEIIKK
jgi:FKBP-type peptidyl-prolyl cis-trans isomerase